MSVKTKQSTIHLSLTPTLEKYVQNLLDSGLYGNVSEIIREALRNQYQSQKDKSAKLVQLRQAIQVGLNQVKNGEIVESNLEDMLKRVIARQE